MFQRKNCQILPKRHYFNVIFDSHANIPLSYLMLEKYKISITATILSQFRKSEEGVFLRDIINV